MLSVVAPRAGAARRVAFGRRVRAGGFYLLPCCCLLRPALAVWRSLGDSNPRFRRERAMSWATRRRERGKSRFAARQKICRRIPDTCKGCLYSRAAYCVGVPPGCQCRVRAQDMADCSGRLTVWRRAAPQYAQPGRSSAMQGGVYRPLGASRVFPVRRGSPGPAGWTAAAAARSGPGPGYRGGAHQ